MRSKRFIVTQQSLPRRCEVCHQEDCFNAGKQECSRCQSVVANLKLTQLQYIGGDFKPLLIEVLEQMSLGQISLILLLAGIIIGIFLDITQLNLKLSSIIAISFIGLSSLSLLSKESTKFHPIITGLLFTLLVAPFGWFILVLINWWAKLLNELLF